MFRCLPPDGPPQKVAIFGNLEDARVFVRASNRPSDPAPFWLERWFTDSRIDPEAGDLKGEYGRRAEALGDPEEDEDGEDEDEDEAGSYEAYRHHVRRTGE